MSIRKVKKLSLCNQDIRDIRNSRDDVSSIAERYNIDESIVRAIIRREKWGYVP
tara:strand:+ start:287 stop:448 length:162 start_codon:yes stop_codon:yes gene_type:complete